MSTNAIRQALESRLSAWAAARTPALRIAWQNSTFSAAIGETYLAPYMLAAETSTYDVEMQHRGYTGIYQVNITTPIGIGVGAAMAIGAELDALFPAGLAINQGGVIVRVSGAASIGPAIQSESMLSVPVTIRYRADTI